MRRQRNRGQDRAAQPPHCGSEFEPAIVRNGECDTHVSNCGTLTEPGWFETFLRRTGGVHVLRLGTMP